MENQNNSLFEQDARNYAKLSEDELMATMWKEWNSIEGKNEISTRGIPKDFFKNVIKRLSEKVIENRPTVSATFGLAIGEVVTWAKSQGLDLTAYRIFISVMAAAVANSVIDELENRTKLNL